MKRIKLFLFCLGLLLFSFSAALQSKNKSDRIKPKWVTQELPQSKSGTYIFIRAHGEGTSLAAAKQMAFVDMSQKLESERGLTINTSLEISERMTQNSASTNSEYKQEITLDVSEKGRKLQIVCREIDDYWEYGRYKYQVDVLYTVTDKNNYGGSYDDDIKITTKYCAAGLLSVIPGMGQIYKGSVKKGTAILVGEIVAAGGIILCENTRASYIKKMKEQPKHASEYNSSADTWETGRNVCIGAAAALYAYNLIDALVANGAKRVIVKKKKKAQFALMPYTDLQNAGLCMRLNF